MNLRRVMLDVDKARSRPEITEIAAAIEAVDGVEAVNITVAEIDTETVGMEVTVEGENIDYVSLIKSINGTGAVVHSTDEIVAGSRVIERVPQVR